MTDSTIGNNLEEIRELLDIEQPAQKLGRDYAWYVGATEKNEQGEFRDYSEEYISDGRWENKCESKYLDIVKSIKVGDKIALKSSYTKKKDLPFNNNGKTVGVMGIKAIGTVTDNPNDGRNLSVEWKRVDPIREWYGKGIMMATIHLVKAEDGLNKKLLLQFTFDNCEQDYSLCEEQYALDIDDESLLKRVVIDERKMDYSVEELGEILSSMYNNSEAVSKATSVHMFGIKYGELIRRKEYSATAIVKEAGLNPSYQAELNKGINIYNSILKNEYGVAFYENNEENIIENSIVNTLPKRDLRTNDINPFNIILYGAPGTGKTYSTVNYALAIIKNEGVNLADKSKKHREADLEEYNKLINDGRIVFTTFHQNYCYEDFIQGLRPDTKKGGINFKNVDGVFKKVVNKAIADKENNYVIIIDEINRANISKVFGELITLIEEDKRWGEENETCTILPSGEAFAVPNNLYIIGTMNSSDKSISLIDTALRRRFEFIEQKPNAELISDLDLRKLFVNLNNRLVDELDSSDLLIGHSYFMNKSVDDLTEIMNRCIIPLLYEYFFDNKMKVAGFLNDILKYNDVEIVDEKIGRLYIKRK